MTIGGGGIPGMDVVRESRVKVSGIALGRQMPSQHNITWF